MRTPIWPGFDSGLESLCELSLLVLSSAQRFFIAAAGYSGFLISLQITI